VGTGCFTAAACPYFFVRIFSDILTNAIKIDIIIFTLKCDGKSKIVLHFARFHVKIIALCHVFNERGDFREGRYSSKVSADHN
jgi:hypothetical protein